MQNLTSISVPIIVSMVYAIIGVLIKAVGNSDKFKRFIPLLAMVLGAVIGGVGFVCEPAIIGAENAFCAIIIGGASGLAATGTDQIVKQLKGNIDVGEGDNQQTESDEKQSDSDAISGKDESESEN